VFIGGTDTGCGKTSVAVALLRAARREGLSVRVLKPVETGCADVAGERRPADALALAEAAGDARTLEQICPYRLALPAAPSVAAAAEGVRIDPARLQRAFADCTKDADFALVEGAGGLRVPICDGLDMVGLARALDLSLVLVARAALGTWNHTLLSLEAARTEGVSLLGVVISHTEPALSPADRSNLDGMLAELPVPCLGELGHGAAAIEPALELRPLLGG
jgi:dethiobiotin synthetase